MEHTETAENVARAVQVGWLWLVPAFPLLGAALNAFLGKRLQELAAATKAPEAAHAAAENATQASPETVQ